MIIASRAPSKLAAGGTLSEGARHSTFIFNFHKEYGIYLVCHTGVRRNHSSARAVPKALHSCLLFKQSRFSCAFICWEPGGLLKSHTKALHPELTMQGATAEYDTCRLHVLLGPGPSWVPTLLLQLSSSAVPGKQSWGLTGTSRKEEVWPHDRGSPGAGLASSASLPRC